MSLSDEIREKSFTGVSAGEIVKREEKDYAHLAERYRGSTGEKFDPCNDERLADCYNFLYINTGQPLTLEKIKLQVDNNVISAGRLVMASWLNAFLYAHEGEVGWDLTELLIDSMRKKGDRVLMVSLDSLNIPSLRQEFFDPNVKVDSKVAISLGSIQMVEMMNSEGVFQNNPDLYKKMNQGALIRKEFVEGE